MSNKRVRVNVDLDFTSGHIDREGINKQINSAIDAVKINLDPQSAKEFEGELKQLGGMLQKHLNEATGKINAKGLVADIDNSANLDMVEKLGARFASVGVNAQKSFRDVSEETDFLNQKLVRSNDTLTRMGHTLQNTIRWNISSSVVNAVTGEFQKMYYFAKDLDRTLNDIRIVTGKSKEEMQDFGVAANKAARDLKTSTVEYGDAATLFYQQGFNEKQVENMTKAAVIASKITGTAAVDMSDLLTSTLNGFTMTTDQILDVVDKFAGVGAETASDFEELSIGMSKVASIGNTAGVSIDQLTGQLATILSVTREAPETVGTALRTIYARMLNFKEDKDALIEDDDGKVFGVPDIEKALADYNQATGAQIRMFETTADGTRTMRDLGDVIEEIGEAWGNTEDKTVKFALTTALAGSRRQNHIIALMDNWDMYKDAVQTSLTSEGTALKQNEIQLESYDAKLKGMQAEKERLFMAITDTDVMKGVVEGATSALSLFTDLVEQADLLSLGVGVIGAVFSDQIIQKMLEAKSLMISAASFNQGSAMVKSPEGNEKQIMEDLITINKAYGDEKANQAQSEIRNLKQIQKEHKINQDLMNAEMTLVKNMKENMYKYGDSAKAIGISDREIAEAEARKENVETAKQLRQHYIELADAKKELAELELQADNLGEREALADILGEAQANVDSIEARIETVHEMSRQAQMNAADASALAEENLQRATDALNKQAEAARKAEQASQVFRSAMLMLPGAVSAAKMETNDLSDKMLGLAKSATPTLIYALINLASATKTAMASGLGLKAALASAIPGVGPILAVVAVIGTLGAAFIGLTHEVDESAITMEKLKENMSELADIEGDISKTKGVIEDIKSRVEEIALIREQTSDGKVLAELNKEEENLERQLQIAERNLEIEKQKLEIKRQEAAEDAVNELNRERELPSFLDPTYDDYMNAETVTAIELVARHTEELEKNERALENIIIRLQKVGLSQEEVSTMFDDGAKDLSHYSDETQQLISDFYALNKNIDKIKKSGADLYDELSPAAETIEGLEQFKGISQELDEGLEELANRLYDLDDAPKPDIGEDPTDEDVGRIGDYANELDYLAAVYYRVADARHEAGSSVDRLFEDYETLLMAEAELNEEGKISYKTYGDLIDVSDDFIGAMDMEQGALADLIRAHANKTTSIIQDARDQQEAVIESVRGQIGAYAELTGAALDAKRIATNNFGGYGEPYVRLDAYVIEEYNKNKREADKMEADLAKIEARKGAIEERAIASRKGSGGGSSKRKSGAKKKEEELAEANRYERLNFLLTKNNSLMSLNGTLRDGMIKGTQEYNDSIKEEVSLQQQRQKLLAERAQELRKEGRELENILSGTFEFEGDWDDNTRIITNMGAIQGKSKETEEQFKRVLEIMKELPEGSEEWRKIQNALDDIKIEEFRVELEKVTKSLDDLADEVFELEYAFQMGDVDDFTRKADRLTGEIELQDRAIKITKASLNAFKREAEATGRVSEELAKQIAETEKRLKEEEIALQQSTRAHQDLIETEKERIKQKELDRRQSEVDAVEQVQEIIVEIIRKRGEEEQRILDENHRKDLERLRKERDARQKNYNDDLDAYRKLINNKIAALDEAYAEEDYIEALLKEQEEANRIQKEIDILSLDDSLTAKNKKADLREQLAAQIEKIEKMERQRSRDATKKALQDELKDYQSQAKDKNDVEEDNYNTTLERLQDEYERKRKALEEEYSNAKVYAEAREALVSGQVEVSKGAFKDIAAAHQEFQEEFGAGMGALGQIIQSEFLDRLYEAESLMRQSPGGFLDRPPQSTEDIPDSDLPGLGYEEPKKPNTSEKFEDRPSEFLYPRAWSQRDYDNYIENKQQWERTTNQDVRRIYEAKNRALRAKYWGSSREMEDNYHWKDLVRLRGYKDGGILDRTGLFVGHGNEQSSEVVFSAKTAKKLWDYVENMPDLKDVKAPTPKTSSLVTLEGNDYNITFDVQGNLDRSLLPEIKDMIEGAISESEFEKVKRLKKAGQFRSI